MQHFDGELEKLVRADVINPENRLPLLTNPGNLRIQMSDLPHESSPFTA